MDEKRKGEIAYEMLKNYLKESNDGFYIGKNFRRHVGNVAKKINVPFQELLEFSTNMATEMLAEVTDVKKPPTEEELEGGYGH